MGTSVDTFNREDILHNRHIQPSNTIFNDLVVTHNASSSLESPILPGITTAHSAEECKVSSVAIRQSRYSFANSDTNERPPSADPAHITYLRDSIPADSQTQIEVPAEHITSLLGKASPDKWMSDVIQVKQKGAKAISPFSIKDDVYLLSPAAATRLNKIP